MNTSNPALEPLTRTHTVLLTTFRRDGSPVESPVSLAVEGDRAVFRTWDTAWKARRLRRDPHVRAAPCTFRGRPLGPAVDGSARLLDGEEARDAARMLRSAQPVLHGLAVPTAHRLKGYRTVHYEFVPAPR